MSVLYWISLGDAVEKGWRLEDRIRCLVLGLAAKESIPVVIPSGFVLGPTLSTLNYRDQWSSRPK